VRPGEFKVAEKIVKSDEQQLKIMFSNSYLEFKLRNVEHRIRMHAELIAVVHGRIGSLNRAELPTFAVFDTRRFLQYWDYESCISSLKPGWRS
jgi:hypothetical protein